MPWRPFLAPSLLALACCACHGGQAVELGWSGTPGAKPPPGWTIEAAGETTVQFLDRAIEITAPSNRQAQAVAAVALPDGSDERPMRLSAVVSAWGAKAIEGYPALVALEWGGGAVFAVGLGDDPHSKRDERRAWAVWAGGGVAGTDHAETELAAGASPTHLRIVLTSRQVVAYGSRDGWAWSRIAGMAREQLGASGAPARVVVGRGQTRSGAAGLAADPPGEAKRPSCSYRFADLRVEVGAAEVPASALRSYAKKDSVSNTIDSLAAPGLPRRWRIRGPEVIKGEPPIVLPAGFASGVGWKEHGLGETERFIQLAKLLPGAGSQMRWASTDLTLAEAGWIRFHFDGAPRCWLWVGGRLVAAPDREIGEAELDRVSANVWLPAGTHAVVLGVHSTDGRAGTTLRWEPGDPLARIALLRRLAIDFTGDEQLSDAPFEMARLWEGLGFAREAAAVLSEAVASGEPELTERAQGERARLFHQLGDEAATAETAALQQRWQAAAADPVVAARRTARLWQRLDEPERALTILGEALALPGLDAQTRCGLAVDRARLRRALGDAPGVAVELRSAAEQLPVGDPARFDLLCAAARLDPAGPRPMLDKQAVDALAARQLAGIQAVRKDEPGRLAARRLAATLPGTPLALPTIELAEDLASAKDEAGALKLYQQELTRRGLPAATDLAASRLAVVRAVLAETAAGVALLAESARILQAATQPLVWQVRGPVPVGDWTPHEKPAFDTAQVPAGTDWKPIPVDFWGGGILDLGRIAGGDNGVYYLATTITSEAARSVTASFGADAALSLWLNGERLYSDRVQRGLTPDSIVLSLPLKAGVNVLLCAVQNGGGATGFQCRTRREPWPASDLAVALAAVSTDRAGSAQILADLAASLVAADRVEEGWTLARTAIACWPERGDLASALAFQAVTQPAWKPPPVALIELCGWFDAAFADRRSEDAGTRRWVQENMTGLLLNAGLADEALARLRCSILTELDVLAVAGVHLREADLWLGLGFPHFAGAAIQKARDAAPGEDAIDREVERRRRAIRGVNDDQTAIAVPFELITLVRTAERALVSNPRRAANDFQQIIDGSGDQPIQLAEGRLRGAGVYAASRLRSSGPAVLEAWRERNADRAASALARLAGGDPQAFSVISRRWPLAPAAGEALRREADLWDARGAWQLARGTALRCLAEHPTVDQGPLLLRAAHASARLGDAVALDSLLARLVKLASPLPWDGSQLPPEQVAAALRSQLPPVAVPVPTPTSVIVRLPPYAMAMRKETVADARLPVPAALLVDGTLIVATPDDLVGVAGDGTRRWSLPAQGRGPVGVDPGASAALAAEAGTVFAGLSQDGSRRLVAVEAATGRQLWSSAGIPALAGATLASAPCVAGGRVWAWFIDASRGFVACLDAREGILLWASTLASGGLRQPLARAGDVVVAGDAPPPALYGRELFVSTDAGQIGAFDAVDGRLLWLHTYARTAIDAEVSRAALRRLMARGRGVILADADRVYVAPRDTLGILALDRAGGGQAWASELADVDELSMLTAAGLVALGPDVSLYNPASGALRLRWRPGSGERPGRPALAGEALWIPLSYGPLRLNLADGALHQGPAWSALGLGGMAPTVLQAAGDALLACADGVVALSTAAGAAKPVVLEINRCSEPSTSSAVPAGDTAPTALAMRWDLPVGHVSSLYHPVDAGDGETYAVAGGWLHRLDGQTGRIAWSVPTAGAGLRTLSAEATWLLAASEGQLAVYDRASGRLAWRAELARDPLLLQSQMGRGRPRVQLARGVVLGWNEGESRFSVRRAEDGRTLCWGRVEGGIWGMHALKEEVQVLVARGNAMVMEVRRLADGVRLQEVQLGIEGQDHAAQLRLPDGGLLISNPAGSVKWTPLTHETVRTDLGLDWVHTAWRDGDVLNLVGQTQERHRSVFFDAAGTVIGQDDFAQWGEWQDHLRLAPRWVAGLRVQVASRNGLVGYVIRRPDGGEQAWLPAREEWRRHLYALLPFGSKAIAFASDKDGWLRVQQIDPKAGKLDLESSFGVTMVGRVQPLAVGGGILVPTTRGLISIIPVAGPSEPLPGRALAESNQAVWKLVKPLVVDGRLDEWGEQAGWKQQAAQAARGLAAAEAPAEPLSAWVGWTDESLAVALRIPVGPSTAPSVLVAIEAVRNEFAWKVEPLLITLTWQGGLGRAQVQHSPVPEDALRPQIQARLASDGISQIWELAVPWGWLFPGGEKPGRDQGLRFGAAVELADPPGAALELGTGLFQGLDKAGLMRLRLVDTKPAADEKLNDRLPLKKHRK